MSAAFTGYLCALISVLGFGSNFTVVAKYDPGDGMFFQLVLCIGIWCTGLVVGLIRGMPQFYPFVLLGGAIWCTGNVGTVFVIKNLGLGPGLVTWGTSALMIGWLTGFFGLFGLHNEQVCMQSIPLNVVGFGLSIVALVDSTLIKKGKKEDAKIQAREPLAGGPANGDGAGPEGGLEAQAAEARGEGEPTDASRGKQLAGVIAAICMGVCFGTNFHPSTWIQTHCVGGPPYPALCGKIDEDASSDGLDYVFNQFCGILLASIIYFLIYCAYMGNKPSINQEIVLPGFVSGILWAIAQTCWFVANVDIGYSAAFPIILIGPGFIGSLWSIFLFKDIHGARNYQVLTAYFVLACSACACIVLSRKAHPPPPCAA